MRVSREFQPSVTLNDVGKRVLTVACERYDAGGDALMNCTLLGHAAHVRMPRVDVVRPFVQRCTALKHALENFDRPLHPARSLLRAQLGRHSHRDLDLDDHGVWNSWAPLAGICDPALA